LGDASRLAGISSAWLRVLALRGAIKSVPTAVGTLYWRPDLERYANRHALARQEAAAMSP
jgi:hypothetical protein